MAIMYQKLLISIAYVLITIHTNAKVFICDPMNPVECQEQATNDCPMQSDCAIQCKDDLSCQGLEIQCPKRGTCTIECIAARSCEGITIHAELSKSLTIQIADSRNVIPKANIYVPNTGTHSKTTIDCGNGDCTQMNIYSKYGVAGINLSCENTECLTESVLYCENKYTTSCPIICAKRECTCEDAKHICNNLNTPNPTKTPTISTVSPSKYPTNIPTISPTINPSLNPTKSPTKSPVREGEANDNENGNSNGNSNGNDSLNNQQKLGIDNSILYVGIIGMIVVLCLFVIASLFWKQRKKNNKIKMKLEMETTKTNRISSVSQASHRSDNEIINGIDTPNTTSNGSGMKLTDTSDLITPMGNETLIDHEGQSKHNEEEMEDMYDDNTVNDGNKMVTETGGMIMTPKGDICMQIKLINEENNEIENFNVENVSNILDEEY